MKIGDKFKKSESNSMELALWANTHEAALLSKGEYWVLAEPEVSADVEIMAQKSYLSSTDWCVIKCLELGLDMETAYPEVFAGRQSARAKINLLEGK